MLACLLQVRAFGWAIKRNFTLLAAALRANAPMHRQAEALLLATIADGTTQIEHLADRRDRRQPLTLWHLCAMRVRETRMDSGFPDAACGKTAWNLAKSAFHLPELGIRYAQVEHSYGSITFKEDYEWQVA